MMTLPRSVRVYVAAQPTDLRKSFGGLSMLVTSTFGQDPLCGHLFVLRSRRGAQIRVLFWDRTGYAILGEKLARGRFHLDGLHCTSPRSPHARAAIGSALLRSPSPRMPRAYMAKDSRLRPSHRQAPIWAKYASRRATAATSNR